MSDGLAVISRLLLHQLLKKAHLSSFWQGRTGSNRQPSESKSDALPVELHPCEGDQKGPHQPSSPRAEIGFLSALMAEPVLVAGHVTDWEAELLKVGFDQREVEAVHRFVERVCVRRVH